MLNIGDRVVHKITGTLGEVCGYGHWIVNNAYLPTVEVILIKKTETGLEIRTIVEDLCSEWALSQEKLAFQKSLTNQPSRLFSSAA